MTNYKSFWHELPSQHLVWCNTPSRLN